MEECSRTRDWKRPLRWLRWWKIDPEELRRQVEGYATLGMIDSARKLGLFLSILSGVGVAAICVFAMGIAVNDVNLFGLAEGVGFVILGFFMYRGNQRAALGLMALCTIDRLFEIKVSFPIRPYQQHIILELLIAFVAWSFYMHTFYVAHCVERERMRVA